MLQILSNLEAILVSRWKRGNRNIRRYTCKFPINIQEKKNWQQPFTHFRSFYDIYEESDVEMAHDRFEMLDIHCQFHVSPLRLLIDFPNIKQFACWSLDCLLRQIDNVVNTIVFFSFKWLINFFRGKCSSKSIKSRAQIEMRIIWKLIHRSSVLRDGNCSHMYGSHNKALSSRWSHYTQIEIRNSYDKQRGFVEQEIKN